MDRIKILIDDKVCYGLPGETILDVARQNDIYIPTLCFDKRADIYGGCGICVVEVEGNPKMVKACATVIAEDMKVKTKTERVFESRKTNLELLLSNHVGDCRPPCVLNCPAGTDCQGYVGLIANGLFKESAKLIKDRIPLPGSIGRVCPHPCEDNCRRKLIDEPISIAWLKRFAADMEKDDPFIPEVAPETGKKVAVIGGGPFGLSAAYYLRQSGHSVTIFEAMPHFGGMLRYGIPQYRLPKEVVDEEVEQIRKMGVTLKPNTKIGVDITFEEIRNKFDAVILGIGAWISTGTGCSGEDAKGILGGIDFLRKVIKKEDIKLGKRVAVVGGGNTAMDCCRTAVRLGAEKVYNIYRRTKDEMPADMIEIEEADEEGVIFKNLTNPLRYITDETGHVKQIELQIMRLDEPDDSGRRAPVPVEGKTEILDVDTVLLAIGQAVDPNGFNGLDLTRKKAISYDVDTYMTSMDGVFAGGDCGNDKISIAVEAIADAKKVAKIADAYLAGERIGYKKPYVVTRDDIDEKTFEDRERQCRPKMDMLEARQRKDNFDEVVAGFTVEQAVEDAKRCLECGCHDYFECKLIDYANQYDVKPDRLSGDINRIDYTDEHPFIVRDPNKCILCGLCVRVCDEVMGIGALGLVNRGFDTVVKPSLEKPLLESGCVSCGMCVSVCPTGALQERQTVTKEVPLKTDITDTTCSYCSVGCSLKLESCGNMLIKANADVEGFVNAGLACGKGKWGFDCSLLEGKLTKPMIKTENGFEEVDYSYAFESLAAKIHEIGGKYGKDKVAVAISDRFTNEEAYTMKKMADTMGARTLCLNNRASGLEPVLGFNASPNSIDQLLSTDVILVVGFSTVDNPVIQLKIKQAAEKGAKVILINPIGLEQHFDFAEKVCYTENNLSVLKGIGKAMLNMGAVSNNKAFDEFAQSLADVNVSSDMAEVAEIYSKVDKAMIVFQQNMVTTEAASMLADIALLSGHIGASGDGILQVKAKNNSQGLIELGITAGAEALNGVKALIVFGEDLDYELNDLEFLAVCDTHITGTSERADMILPGTGFASADGTFINTEGRLMPVTAAIKENVQYNNLKVATEIARAYKAVAGVKECFDINYDLGKILPDYKGVKLGDMPCETRIPEGPAFVVVPDAAMTEPLTCTDNLMNMISKRLPVPSE